ncbi:MAG: hypothetical protein AMXMBFR48_09250 [Ignavibacteriales bacterium]
MYRKLIFFHWIGNSPEAGNSPKNASEGSVFGANKAVLVHKIVKCEKEFIVN